MRCTGLDRLPWCEQRRRGARGRRCARLGLGVLVLLTMAWAPIAAGPAAASEYSPTRAARFQRRFARWFPRDLFHAGNPHATQLKRFMVAALAEGYADLTARERRRFMCQIAAPRRAQEGTLTHRGRIVVQLAKFAATGRVPLDAERVRAALNVLGPGFIKLGQLLSVRPDLITESLAGSLSNLCDRVDPVPFRAQPRRLRGWWSKRAQVDLATMLEKDTGPIESRFQEITEEPEATASVGQVHAATDIHGQAGVLKIIKPGVGRLLDRNFAAFERALARGGHQTAFLKSVLREVHEHASAELDARLEADNLRRLAEQVGPDWEVPRVLGNWGPRALFLERAPGKSIAELVRADQLGADERQWLAGEIGALALRGPIFNAVFHADPSPANIFFDPQGSRQRWLLDGGMVGQGFTPDQREAIAQLGLAVWLESKDSAVKQLAALCSGQPFFQRVETAVNEAFAGHQGSMFRRLNALLAHAEYQGVPLPSSVRMAVKAIYQAEGTARRLDPNFQITARVLVRAVGQAAQAAAATAAHETLTEILRSPTLDDAAQVVGGKLQGLEKTGTQWLRRGIGALGRVVREASGSMGSDRRDK